MSLPLPLPPPAIQIISLPLFSCNLNFFLGGGQNRSACRSSRNLPCMNDSLDFSGIQSFHPLFFFFFQSSLLDRRFWGLTLSPRHACKCARTHARLHAFTHMLRQIYAATLKSSGRAPESTHSELPGTHTYAHRSEGTLGHPRLQHITQKLHQ